MILVMGDFNARVIKATNDLERTVIGTHTLMAEGACPEKLDQDTTKDNRDRFIEWCIENGLKLENTMFEKPIEKLATYKPPGISYGAKISVNTHWQTDYIATAKGNIRITNCETDTKADRFRPLPDYRRHANKVQGTKRERDKIQQIQQQNTLEEQRKTQQHAHRTETIRRHEAIRELGQGKRVDNRRT